MDPETFNNIASGIQSLILSVAVVVGGLWALIRFGSLKEIDRAKAELEETKRRLFERGILDITLHPKEISRVEDLIHYVLVEVTIHNTGNRSEVINWSKSGVYVSKMETDESGRPEFGRTYGAKYMLPGEEVPASSILPEQTRMIPFLFPLANRGIYHLLFRAAVSPLEETIHAQEHRVAGIVAEEYLWQSSTYFSVGEGTHPCAT